MVTFDWDPIKMQGFSSEVIIKKIKRQGIYLGKISVNHISDKGHIRSEKNSYNSIIRKFKSGPTILIDISPKKT